MRVQLPEELPAEDEAAAGSHVASTPEAWSMHAPSVMEGTVEDAEGRGIGGVRVHVAFSRGHCNYIRSCGEGEGESDESGRFALPASPDAVRAAVTIDAPEWVQPRGDMIYRGGGTVLFSGGAATVAWPLPCGEPAAWPELRIILERGHPVEGVVETDSGVAAAGALIEATWTDGAVGQRASGTRADERGRFRITIPVAAMLAAFGGIGPRGGQPQAWMGPVRPGSSGLRMVLRETVSLDLQVDGPEGRIGGYVAVRVHPAEFASRGPFTANAYVRDGENIQIPMLPGTYDVEVLPVDEDCLAAHARVSLPGPPVEIRCPSATKIEGLLEGAEVDGFEITWTGPCNPEFQRGLFDPKQNGATTRLAKGVKEFRFEAVGDGSGDIYARRPGDARCAVVRGFRPRDGYLRLRLTEGASIRGRVVAPHEADLRRVRVRATAGSIAQYAHVERDGTFSVVGLPVGDFRVDLVSLGRVHFEPRGRERWEYVTFDAREGIATGTEDLVLRLRLPVTGGS